MFAQLGTTVFDGQKSFVSFNNEQEAIIVEHALIGRRAQLQGAAIGLRNINLTIFLHQEYCKVSQEIEKLRKSLNTFEILPLLWGNGKIEGEFVIQSLSVTNQDMDALGNIIAAEVSLSLKENVSDDRVNQQEQEAKQNAFAVGDKKPPTKSNRINPEKCNAKVSNIISEIKSHAYQVDVHSLRYSSTPNDNSVILKCLSIIFSGCQKLMDASNDTTSCIYQTSVGPSAVKVQSRAKIMADDVKANQADYLNPFPNISGIKADNYNLQTEVRVLQSSANGIIQSSIVKK
ncbi:phage tail protein [Pinibacter soli]|uniref:Phage tail protein n=1 Tax=Pinibacter soli TaxID=3044211 RepID=A0ABT6RDP8_9BACT|nr:phage tail protein [Pinibacter soli]MDI3319994.1 phage tail protein [Pinibacter soli]